eukprot:1911145-Prorocentrum_lima.AAC.1
MRRPDRKTRSSLRDGPLRMQKKEKTKVEKDSRQNEIDALSSLESMLPEKRGKQGGGKSRRSINS